MGHTVYTYIYLCVKMVYITWKIIKLKIGTVGISIELLYYEMDDPPGDIDVSDKWVKLVVMLNLTSNTATKSRNNMFFTCVCTQTLA